MNEERFLFMLAEQLRHFRLYQLDLVFRTPSDATKLTVEPFGIVAPGDTFNLGWTLQLDSSEDLIAQAFSSGAATFERGSPNRIILNNLDILKTLVETRNLPTWTPTPRFIIYENVDVNATKELIEKRLNETGNLKNFRSAGRSEELSARELTEKFLDGELLLPVASGDPIGVASRSQTGTSLMRVFFQDALDNVDNLFLDPAIYHDLWRTSIRGLQGHPLEATLRRVFAGFGANGTIRYVGDGDSPKAGNNLTEPYVDPSFPARKISDAVNATTSPQETVVLLKTRPEIEGEEIVLTNPINITSLVDDDATTVSLPAFPIVDGNADHRVFRIQDAAGPVSLSRLRITNGSIDSFGTDEVRSGAGVLIERSHQTLIRNCRIYGNEASSFLFERLLIPILDGCGGGIHCHESSAFICLNRVDRNSAGARGGGVGITGYGWPVFLRCVLSENRTEGGNASDGGAIGATIANPNIVFPSPNTRVDFGGLQDNWDPARLEEARRNRIKVIESVISGNSAYEDGGGIYLSVMSRALILNTEIHQNTARHAAGGIRMTMASDVKIIGGKIYLNQANRISLEQDHDPDDALNGGGGISARNSSLVIDGAEIRMNETHGFAGGGVFFNSTTAGSLIDSVGDELYNRILEEVFQPQAFELLVSGATRIEENACALVKAQRDPPPKECKDDRRKGGGLYILRFENKKEEIVGLPIKVILDDVRVIKDNRLEPDIPTPQCQHSYNLHIEDFVNRPGSPITEVALPILTKNYRLVYSSNGGN